METRIKGKRLWLLLDDYHVHLVLAPNDDTENIGKLMKRLAGRQTRYVNHQEGRSGSLWEGRYKSSPIETNAYLLACLRYVERNPVKAGMVENVADYEWSSYAQHSGLTEDNWLDGPNVFKFRE